MYKVVSCEDMNDGIVKMKAQHKHGNVEMILSTQFLDVDLSGAEFTLMHSPTSIAGDLTFHGTVVLKTPECVLVSNGGLLMLKHSTKLEKELTYGQEIYTSLNFKLKKRRRR